MPMRRLWSMLPAAGVIPAFDVSANLDCARDAAGALVPGRPGTLYAVGRKTGKLYAVIVDSPGLEGGAHWPRFQHDPRNSGAADTPATEYSCP